MTMPTNEQWAKAIAGPLVDLFLDLSKHETAEADRLDAEYRAEDNGDDDENRMDPESWGFRRTADAFGRCAEELLAHLRESGVVEYLNLVDRLRDQIEVHGDTAGTRMLLNELRAAKAKLLGNGADVLNRAIEFAESVAPLLRCRHGHALKDGSGEHLEPSCGCRVARIPESATPAATMKLGVELCDKHDAKFQVEWTEDRPSGRVKVNMCIACNYALLAPPGESGLNELLEAGEALYGYLTDEYPANAQEYILRYRIAKAKLGKGDGDGKATM